MDEKEGEVRRRMRNWSQILRQKTGLNLFVWIVFYILPFYFVFRSSSTSDIVFGISMIFGYFICYVLSFVSKGKLVYFWTGVQIAISCVMGIMFGYIYFSLFLAYFLGNLKNRILFYLLYSIHIASTLVAVYFGFMRQRPEFLEQLPFILLCLIIIVLLPISSYNRNKEDQLQGQLDDANKRISELVKLEERQRIARDLHDTIGQKLSLIGLKSELAGKLIHEHPKQAATEIQDVYQTARTALNEVRELVTQMRGTKLEDELQRVQQVLRAAQIELTVIGDPRLKNTSLIAENVISMCLKEAVTNIVKHSQATACEILIEPGKNELIVTISDNGIGMNEPIMNMSGNGIRGMRERASFVNGSLDIITDQGTKVIIKVPNSHARQE